MIYLGSDHGGFEKKEAIKRLLKELDVSFKDLGNETYDPADDYPDFARKVAEQIAKNPEKDRGILLCRSGVGVDVTANKVRGVRSALVFNETMARYSRLHDNANVLALAADYLSDDAVLRIVKAWLETNFSGEERHKRRLAKITGMEQAVPKDQRLKTKNQKHKSKLPR